MRDYPKSRHVHNLVVLSMIGLGAVMALKYAQEPEDKAYYQNTPLSKVSSEKLKKLPDEFWKQRLSPKQFDVCRKGGTELPGTGKWNTHYSDGVYTCSACGHVLFDSKTKYDSKSGWPSFWDVAQSENLEFVEDNSLGTSRIEVRCAHCGAHLGHVFDDGPAPTGKRYCINSVCLDFKSRNSESSDSKQDNTK